MEYYKNTNIETLENEIWIDAIGFDGLYSVSNFGRIRSEEKFVNSKSGGRNVNQKILKQSKLSNSDYLVCGFSINNKCYKFSVSNMIYLSFNKLLNFDKKKYCICHIDKCYTNNTIDNLFMMSISDSHKINFKKGLLPHLAINNKNKKEKSVNEKYKLIQGICCASVL